VRFGKAQGTRRRVQGIEHEEEGETKGSRQKTEVGGQKSEGSKRLN